MCRKICVITAMILTLCLAMNLQAREAFSIRAFGDITLDNGPRAGQDGNRNTTGLEARDSPDRRHVFLVSYDISELKGSGATFENIYLSHFSHDVHAATNVYGVIEDLDLLEVESLTWKTSPGVKNDPLPELNSPVIPALDLNDLSEVLLTFEGPGATGVRFDTDVNEALAEFINSDTDGILTFLFAPAAPGNNLIVRSKEHSSGGTLLEGLVGIDPAFAQEPMPENREDFVARSTDLSWKPGIYAATHSVYLSTRFADVNEGSVDALVAEGLTEPKYTPDPLLTYGETYCWRVDEVNAAPDDTVIPGPVWSFTVEPENHPLAGELITVTASVSDKDPMNTINGSGLDADALHSTDTATMWLTSSSPDPAWIQYDFDKVYQLQEMLVWNYNGEFPLSWNGCKEVTVEHSEDGNVWTPLGSVSEFAQAPGTVGYASNTVVDFNGMLVKHVRITVLSNWSPGGVFAQYGLSEVRFLYKPLRAWKHSPAHGVSDVDPAVVLSWRSGREAQTHEVYLGSDPTNLPLVGTVTGAPCAAYDTTDQNLQLGQTYHWQVNEVNDAEVPSVWASEALSFVTKDVLSVDDFESYSDDWGNIIFQSWIDGWGWEDPDGNKVDGNGSGATVGYLPPPTTEEVIVNSGSQAMPLAYNNQSETTAQIADLPNNEAGSDWTRSGITRLVLHVNGDLANLTGRLYVKINDQKVSYAPADAITPDMYNTWSIDLSSLDVTDVKTLSIGVEGTGLSGTLYVDDIELMK